MSEHEPFNGRTRRDPVDERERSAVVSSVYLSIACLSGYRAIGRCISKCAIVLILQLGGGAHARAEDLHLGIIEYEISCMPCHGIDGRGNGPRAKLLKTAPADLTRIAKSNNGDFPSETVAHIVDGRATVAAHGARDMPVWGDRYRTKVDATDTLAKIDHRARAQIAALVRYLKTIQEK